ncbi:hypothetical protein RCO48_35575 [Peribacillus frigoritolerans]|nr:hypothetical protein [Peribacillus frigoritolerans]
MVPHSPTWIWCAVFIVLLFTLNALTTRGFAEAEYWFAGIKIVAVIFVYLDWNRWYLWFCLFI